MGCEILLPDLGLATCCPDPITQVTSVGEQKNMLYSRNQQLRGDGRLTAY